MKRELPPIILIALLIGRLLCPTTAASAATQIWQGTLPDLSVSGKPPLAFPVQAPGATGVLVSVRLSLEPSDPIGVVMFHAGPGQPSTPVRTFRDPLDGTPGRVFGTEIANLGDVDGDGYDDLGICASVSNFSLPGPKYASFYLYRGGPGMDITADFELTHAVNPDFLFARGVEGGGDFNGDGFADFLMEVLDQSAGGTPKKGHLYFGGPDFDSEVDLIFDEVNLSAYEGDRASIAHDLNGDGFSDLVLLAPVSSLPAVRVFLGGANADALADLEFETSVVAQSLVTGDVTGDGIADLCIMGRTVRVFEGGEDFDLVVDRELEWEEIRTSNVNGYRPQLIRRVSGRPAPEIMFDLRFDDQQATIPATGPWEGVPTWGIPSPGLNLSEYRFAVSPDIDGNGADELFALRGRDFALYDRLYFDVDGNTIPDNEQALAGTLPDCDGNGVADGGEVATWPVLDCDGDSERDSCQLDEFDCDGNGEVDACQIEQTPTLDCDNDGQIDSCVPVSGQFDRDGNGLADCREIYLDASLDCNGDGILDLVQVEDIDADCNGNGLGDFCEIFGSPWLDCNGDHEIDSCQMEDQAFDCNYNQVLDVCEEPTEAIGDCNFNQRSDLCEIRSEPDTDCDGNGILDACTPAPPGTSCSPPPYIGVYFDEELTTTQIPLAEVPQFGEIFVALRGGNPSLLGSMTHFELSMELPSELAPMNVSYYVPGAEDLTGGPALDQQVVFRDGPVAIGADGTMRLMRIEYYRLSPLASPASVRVSGSQWGSISTGFPTLQDAATGGWRVIDSRLARFGESLEDCNANGIDDALDIASGTSFDADGNGFPDECGVVSSPHAPRRLALHAPFPNPFNPRTRFGFYLPEAATARLVVYDASGRRVRLILDEKLEAGDHFKDWDGSDRSGHVVSSGVYFVRLEANGQVLTRKAVLLR